MCFAEHDRYAAKAHSNGLHAAARHGYGYAGTSWLSTIGFWYIPTSSDQFDAMMLVVGHQLLVHLFRPAMISCNEILWTRPSD